MAALATMLDAAPHAAAASSEIDAQIKALGQRYNQVEAQLARSVHYLKKETAGDGATTTEQAWFNGAGDLLKVVTERSDAAGRRELTESVARYYDNAYNGLFVVHRKVTPLPDGGTQVDEERKYFGSAPAGGNGVLLRELRKSARFRAGETLDTVKAPNTVVFDLDRQPRTAADNTADDRAQNDIFERPGQIAAALQKAGPPDSDPFAKVQGDRARFRVIHSSASPDGRYAIAIGFAQPVDWEKDYRDSDFTEATVYTASDNDDKLRNYVVELATARILGETGCAFFGTRQRYNHRACSVNWSPDSAWFVELTEEKWNYNDCHAGHVAAAGGPKLLGCPDVGKAAEKNAAAFLAPRKRRLLQESSIAITNVSVDNAGVVELTLLGSQNSGARKGAVDFSTDQRLRLRPGANGALSIETLSVRASPPQQE
ncbi:MAG: hypothetical protein JO117_04585 [Verrucomicrobia bacterium]|nr:hypothetical protein [Verrucomicrobiota bacterium]